MAHLLRLIAFALALLLSNSALAAFDPTVEYKAEGCPFGGNFPTSWTSSRQAACGQIPNACAQLQGVSSNVIVFVEGQYCQAQNAGGGILASISIQTRSDCPAGAALSGASCSCFAGLEQWQGQCKAPCAAGEIRDGTGVCRMPCPAGQHEEGGACVPDTCKPSEIRVNGVCVPEPPCPEGQMRVNGRCVPSTCPRRGTPGPYYDVVDKSSFSICGADKCTLVSDIFLELRKDGQVVGISAGTKYTGAVCSNPTQPNGDRPGTPGDNPGDGGGGDGDPDPDPDNPGGGTGGTPGDGGGDGDDDDGPQGPSGGTNPDVKPTPTPTPGDPGGGPDGGVNPPGDGPCPPDTYLANGKCWPNDPPPIAPDGDGKCPPGYAKVGTDCVKYQPEPDKDKEEEEKEKEGKFGGACGGFTCDGGDAIQCAIALEVHRRACLLYDDKSTESDIYDVEKAKDPLRDVTKELPGNEEIDIAGKLNRENVLGGAACIQDLNIVVHGMSVSLPMSKICPALSNLGLILVAIAFIVAARIITKS